MRRRTTKKHRRLQSNDTQLPLWLGAPALLFATLLLAVVLIFSARTQSGIVPVLVTTQQATVYSVPDDDAATVFAVPRNVTLTVLEQKDGWYRICLNREDALYGWLKASDLTQPEETLGGAGPSGATGLLLGSAENMIRPDAVPDGIVKLYAGPGSTYGKVGETALGKVVQVLDYADGWFRVTFSGGEGFVPADALLLDTNPFIIQEENEGEDEQQDEESTTPNDGQQDETSSTDDDKQDETSSTDDGKQDEASSTDDNKQDEPSGEAEAEEKEPPVALPSSSTKVLAAGVINTANVRLRKGPGTDYDIITEMSKGVPVAILGWEDGWYKAAYAGKTGYVSDELVNVYPTTDSLKGYAIVSTEALNMRATASTSGKIVAVVEEGDCLTLKGFNNGWFKVSYDGKTGYVSGDYVELRLSKPAEPTTQSPSNSSSGSGSSTGSSTGSGVGADIAAYAQTFIGTPYVMGGAKPSTGFDCSGFVQYVYKHFGYSLPRTSNDQYKKGTAVSKSNLQPGDLIFFDNGTGTPTSHVGIYIGNGKFVHSTEYNYGSGNWVKGVQIHPLSNAWYTKIYLGARRIVG